MPATRPLHVCFGAKREVEALVLDGWPRLLGWSNGGSFTTVVVRCTSHPLHQMAGLHDNATQRHATSRAPLQRVGALDLCMAAERCV
jgi:hypothetical protein